jgi:hypothetical protein
VNAYIPHNLGFVFRLAARCIFPEDRRTFPPTPQVVFYQAGLGEPSNFDLKEVHSHMDDGLTFFDAL